MADKPEQLTDAEIADLCERLAKLLRAAEYGLSSWQAMRIELARKLRDALVYKLG
jgi:hypothetical protein